MEEEAVKFTGFLDRMIEENSFVGSILSWLTGAIGEKLGSESQRKAEEHIRKKNWKEFRKLLIDLDDEMSEKKKPIEKPKPVVKEKLEEIVRPTLAFKEALGKMDTISILVSQIGKITSILEDYELPREKLEKELKRKAELSSELDKLSSSIEKTFVNLVAIISQYLGVNDSKMTFRLMDKQPVGWETVCKRVLRKVEKIMYFGGANKFLIVIEPYKKKLDSVENELGKEQREYAEKLIYDIQIEGEVEKRDDLKKIFKLAKVANVIGKDNFPIYLKAIEDKDEEEIAFIERLVTAVGAGKRFSASDLELVRMSTGDDYANAIARLSSAEEHGASVLEIARLQRAAIDLGLASRELKREIRAERVKKIEAKPVKEKRAVKEKKAVSGKPKKIKRSMAGTSKRKEERKAKALRRYRTVSPIRKDISELAEKWFDRMQRDVEESGKNRVKTIKTYRYGITTFSRWLGERDYKILRHSDATLYVDWLQDAPRKYKSRTIQVKLSSVSKFFEYMLARDLVPINPFSVAKAPKAGELKPRPLSSVDDDEFLTYMDSVIEDAMIRLKSSGVTKEFERGVKWRVKEKRIKHEARVSLLKRDACIALLFMRFSGMRVSEVFDLEPRWIKKAIKFGEEGEDRGFQYRRIITVKHGKGSKERMTILVPYFTPKREQINRFQEYVINFIEEKQKTGGRLFLRDQSWLRRFLKRIKNEGRIAKGVTFHRLRHTYAQTLLDSGASIELIAELLGHTDIRTTKGYSRVTSRILEENFVKQLQ